MKRTTTLKIFLAFLFVNFVYYSNAQLNYLPGGFTIAANSYVDLGTNGNVIPVANNDDAFSAPQPIGFTFNFNGAAYDSFVFSTNGFIKLGRDSASRHFLFTTFAQPPSNGVFTSATLPTPFASDSSMLFAMGQDLFGGSSTPEFRVFTDGFSGAQVCTIQWKNVKDKTQASTAGLYDTINFQIKLYESTNVVEYVYGNWTTTINQPLVRFAAVGIVGSSVINAAQNLHLVKGSTIGWTNTVANQGFYLNNAVNYRNPISTPAGPAPVSGTTFRFTPITANDASVKAIYTQGKTTLNYSISDSIRANISNNGVSTLTSVVVTLDITGAHSYTTTATIPSLGPGLSTNVSFAPFIPTNTGASVITVSVPTDDNNANNTLSNSYFVNNYEMSYRDTLLAHSGSNGITIPNFWGAKFFVSGDALLTTVRSFLVSNADAVGDTVCGMILDTLGNVIARSANRIVQASDQGTTMNFNIQVPIYVTNKSVIAGIAGSTAVNGLNYFLGTSQTENPFRTNNPFYFLTTGTALSNSTVGTFYALPGATGNQTTRLMMECHVRPIPQIEVGVTASSISTKYSVPTGVSIPFRAIVKNYGMQNRPAGIAVRYSVNNGPVIGPINTTTAIAHNDTTSVLFTGANAITFASAGTYTVKIFTSLVNDSLVANDTLIINYTASPRNTVPFRTSGATLTSNWTIDNASNVTTIWKTTSCVMPNGATNTSFYADNFNYVSNGRIVSTSAFNFTGVTNPTLYYSLAHAPKILSGDDTLDVEVSTDGGSTFTVVQTLTSQTSNPSLGTAAAQSSFFLPSSASQWRNATVDLSAYANNGFVMIAFRSRSGLGNSIFLNNINVLNPPSTNYQSVPSPTIYSSGIVTVNYNTSVGASNGVLAISAFNGSPVFSAASPVFATNTTATTNNTAIFTPDVISPSAWFTINYSGIGTGNLPSTAPFDLSISTTTIGGIQSIDSLYIVRRSESNGSWIALNTSRTSTLLTVYNITDYGDFGIASSVVANTLPVSWLSFKANKLDKNTAQLAWSTAQEMNNKGFEIESSVDGRNFNRIGFVKGAGVSTKVNNYSFTDAAVNSNVVFYRLKQLDYDGKFNYSNTIQLADAINAIDMAEVSPNPFDNELTVKLNATSTKPVQVDIYNADGKLVNQRTMDAVIGANNFAIEGANNLPKGFYILKVNQNGNTKTFKLVK
ncbi:MAG: T9SS type A sorting domain-containing protein [Bacteroidota bacterium]